ncbi:MAG: hypothetical protein MI923_25280 [Phycisphaerales bacterium]|nr:hypothetical protein [Phycisphaerales bacterium]
MTEMSDSALFICKCCRSDTAGSEIEGQVVAFCPTCRAACGEIYAGPPEQRRRLLRLLGRLDEDERHALYWNEDRRAAWSALRGVERVILCAICHLCDVWPGEKFKRVTLPMAVSDCILDTSRSALFTTLYFCVFRICGHLDRMDLIHGLFDGEDFEEQYADEPLGSFAEVCERDALPAVVYECLDVLFGTYSLPRIRKNVRRGEFTEIFRGAYRLPGMNKEIGS